MPLALLYDTTFAPTNTDPGTIDDTPATGAADAWADESGANYHNVEVGGVGYLTSRNPSADGQNFARWNGGETQLDCCLVVDWPLIPLPGSQGQIWGFGLRMQATGDKALVAWGYPGHFELRRLNHDYPTQGISALSNPLAGAAEAYADPGTGLQTIMWVSGTAPTTIRVQLRNPANNAILYDQTTTETDPAYQNAGRPFVWAGPFGNGVDQDRQTIARVRYYSGTGDPFVVTAEISLTSATPTHVNLEAVDPGVPFTWEVSEDNFATAGTTVPGETGLTLSYAMPDDLVRYFRVAIAGDAETNYSNVVAASREGEPIRPMYIGDSILEGGEATVGGPDSIARFMTDYLVLALGPRTVTYSNQAHGGATTALWVPGQPYYTAAIAAAATFNPTHIILMLGANEANIAGLAGSSANMDLILAGLRADIPGVPIVLEGNTAKGVADPLAAAFFPAWDAESNAKCDGTTVIRGDRTTYRTISQDPGRYLADAAHPTAKGRDMIGIAWGTDFVRQFYPKAEVGGEIVVRRIGSSRIRGGF